MTNVTIAIGAFVGTATVALLVYLLTWRGGDSPIQLNPGRHCQAQNRMFVDSRRKMSPVVNYVDRSTSGTCEQDASLPMAGLLQALLYVCEQPQD